MNAPARCFQWLSQTLRTLAPNAGLASLGAVLYFVGFCGYDQWYLSYLALVPMIFAWRGLTMRQAFVVAWFGGWVTHLGGFYWVAQLLHDFAFLPWPVAWIGCLLVCLFQSAQFGIWALLSLRLGRHMPLGLAAALAWVASEFIAPQIFPSYLGNSQYLVIPIIQVADLGGILMVSLVVAAFNGGIYELAVALRERAPRRGLARAAIGAGVVALALGYGYLRLGQIDAAIAAAPKKKVGMVQANFGIYEKGAVPGEDIARHQELSLEAERQAAQLIVWPESAFPLTLSDRVENYSRPVLGGLTTPLVFGAVYARRDSGEVLRTNSALLVAGDGTLRGRYDKIKLLVFGEYLPLGELFPAIYKLSPSTGHYEFGTSYEPLRIGDFVLGVNICYEDILPRLVRQLALHKPNLFVNVTNDAWYGNTTEPIEHLALAAFRSVEHRRAMARSTNTGLSAFIDPAGRIVQRSGRDTKEVLVRELPLMDAWSLYTVVGDWLGWLTLTICVWSFTRVKLKRRRAKY